MAVKIKEEDYFYINSKLNKSVMNYCEYQLIEHQTYNPIMINTDL